MKTRADPARAEIEERLERLFHRVSRMSDAELMVLRAIWDEQDETARAVAWKHAKRITGEHGRTDLLEHARSRLSAWVNNYLSATAIEYGNFLISASGMDAATIRRVALPPLLDAAAAIVAADGLDVSEQAVLLEPTHPDVSPGSCS